MPNDTLQRDELRALLPEGDIRRNYDACDECTKKALVYVKRCDTCSQEYMELTSGGYSTVLWSPCVDCMCGLDLTQPLPPTIRHASDVEIFEYCDECSNKHGRLLRLAIAQEELGSAA